LSSSLYEIRIKGLVQGVGFRPFVYKLATSLRLVGYVKNSSYGVLIVLDTSKERLKIFVEKLKQTQPQQSEIESIELKSISFLEKFSDFRILENESNSSLSMKIPADMSMCLECQREMEDEDNRRFNYPFISCVNCGPRFSIIKNLPYDRDKTSMKEFPMCKKCEGEYKDPKDRRYHAQPIGCFECGPQLILLGSNAAKIESKNLVEKVAALLKNGSIVALKGVGGYQLICDANNTNTLKLLRQRKHRPIKPLAVMVKNIDSIKEMANVMLKEEELLVSNKRAIVLLKTKENDSISDLVAPSINQVGFFLPPSPLHHLLLEEFDGPLVVTSANLSGEPISVSSTEIMKLSGIWDYCLDHDREILNSCDDSVVFVENSRTFILRSARGYSPSYLKLPTKTTQKILCLGANQKSSVGICVENTFIGSPYIGDLDSLSSVEHFKSHIESLKRIYDFEPEIIVCDKHPNYESTKYAFLLKEQNPNIEVIQVQHHYAHILATMGKNAIESKVLGVSFDGTGYGTGGSLWGGEFFLCDNKSYERVGHVKEFKLLGSEKAIKEPRRVALSFLFDLYTEDVLELTNAVTAAFSDKELKTLYLLWKKGLNSPLTSSFGRVFDGVASLLDIIQVSSYEGESGLLMETLYDEKVKEFFPFSIKNGVIDFHQVFEQLLREEEKIVALSKFFNTIVEIIYEMGMKYKLPIVLSGGVFQNRVLLRLIMQKLPDVILPEEFVSNDGAIAYGQAIAVNSKLEPFT